MLDQERRDHAMRIMERNHVTIDELLPQCKTYAEAKSFSEEIENNYSEYADYIRDYSADWDHDVIASMWDEWYQIIWDAIKHDHWICGATCSWCLHLLSEQYLSSKWYIPLPKPKKIA